MCFKVIDGFMIYKVLGLICILISVYWFLIDIGKLKLGKTQNSDEGLRMMMGGKIKVFYISTFFLGILWVSGMML